MKKIEVVAAVIQQNNTFLATQRGYGEFKGMWEFPGGKVEPDENHEDALKREIREELCIEVAVGELLTTIEYDYPTFHLTMHCYLCEISNGELILQEHLAARWLKLGQLDEVEWLPADIEVIVDLKALKY